MMVVVVLKHPLCVTNTGIASVSILYENGNAAIKTISSKKHRRASIKNLRINHFRHQQKANAHLLLAPRSSRLSHHWRITTSINSHRAAMVYPRQNILRL